MERASYGCVTPSVCQGQTADIFTHTAAPLFADDVLSYQGKLSFTESFKGS